VKIRPFATARPCRAVGVGSSALQTRASTSKVSCTFDDRRSGATLLLAVVRLGDGTYGAEIQREFTARTGRDVTPGTIYPTLDRLEGNLLRSWMGEATPKGGGRDRPSVSVDSGLARALRAGAKGLAWQWVRPRWPGGAGGTLRRGDEPNSSCLS
jgi:hypothetical protein